VWRVKWHPHPSRKDDLLVACMHDGFKVLHYDDAASPMDTDTSTRFDEHGSLAYGADWSFATADSKTGKSTIGSCSFYDHLLQIWQG
jgi:diphthamide biosynthesis protein 7